MSRSNGQVEEAGVEPRSPASQLYYTRLPSKPKLCKCRVALSFDHISVLPSSLAASWIKFLHLRSKNAQMSWKFSFIHISEAFHFKPILYFKELWVFFPFFTSIANPYIIPILNLPVYLVNLTSLWGLQSGFDYFTCNQHSFIKKLFISFSVAQSTDYCDNCKTYRAFPSTLWQTIGLINSTTRNMGSSLFQHT